MVYFFILPAFLFAVVVQVVLLAATTAIPTLLPVRPLLGRVLLWSSIGFVAGNVLLMVFTVLPFGIYSYVYNYPDLEQSGWVLKTLGWIAMFGLTIGPFLATALGFGGGLLVGVLLTIRAKPRSAPAMPAATHVQ